MKKRLAMMLVLSITLLLVACSKKDNASEEESSVRNDVAIADIIKDVQEAYGDDFVATNVLDDATIKELMGIDAEWCDELYASNSMIGVHKDTFIAVKAKPEDLNKVIEAVNAYRDAMIDDTNQYPMNVQKIQASRIDVYGNYVFFTLLGFIPTGVEEQSDDEILKAYQEQNEKAVEVYESYFKA